MFWCSDLEQQSRFIQRPYRFDTIWSHELFIYRSLVSATIGTHNLRTIEIGVCYVWSLNHIVNKTSQKDKNTKNKNKNYVGSSESANGNNNIYIVGVKL